MNQEAGLTTKEASPQPRAKLLIYNKLLLILTPGFASLKLRESEGEGSQGIAVNLRSLKIDYIEDQEL
jgi:hypothetical protein